MKRVCAFPGCDVEFEVKEDVERFRNTPKYCSSAHRKEAQRKLNKERYDKVKAERKRRKQYYL